MELKACCEGEPDMIKVEEAKNHKRLRGCIITARIDWGKGDTASGTSYMSDMEEAHERNEKLLSD